jgi:hypothetical protein
VESVLALGSHGRIETFPRQVLGCPERGARDAGVQHGKGRVADRPGLGQELRVDQIRRVAVGEELRASGRGRQRSGRHARDRIQREDGYYNEALQHVVTRTSLLMGSYLWLEGQTLQDVQRVTRLMAKVTYVRELLMDVGEAGDHLEGEDITQFIQSLSPENLSIQ